MSNRRRLKYAMILGLFCGCTPPSKEIGATIADLLSESAEITQTMDSDEDASTSETGTSSKTSSSSAETTMSTTSGETSATTEAAPSLVELTPANVAPTSVALSIPAVTTAPADLEVCFDQVLDDLGCSPIDPIQAIRNVALIEFSGLSEFQVAQSLAGTGLEIRDIAAYHEYRPTGASPCFSLSAMEFGGDPLVVDEHYVAGNDRVYLLSFHATTQSGADNLSMLFLRPDTASSVDSVVGNTGCGIMTTAIDFSAALPIPVPTDGPWSIGWRDLDTDSQGRPFEPNEINRLAVGFYEGRTASELESSLPRLEVEASAIWEVSVPSGSDADLAEARNVLDGSPFPGFAGNGTWLFMLTCDGCQPLPNPRIVAVLAPSP